MKIKRFIDCLIPVTTCNFRCHYCYITHNRMFSAKLPTWKYTPEQMGQALSVNRLGGVCLFNFCGGGETLLPPEMPELIRQVLLQGHYIMVVTNGSVSPRFDEICSFDPALLKRLFFKFSFHYEQLTTKKRLDTFLDNVQKVRDAGCSCTIELTPHDEMIPLIGEIQQVCMERLGALCHITVTRNEKVSDFPLLTELPPEEFKKAWQVFDSKLFDFKYSVFSQKRSEFCYAGDWSAYLDFDSGTLRQCYRGKRLVKDLFAHPHARIPWSAIGRHCYNGHCFNAHAFLTLGVIPELQTPAFAEMRDRTCSDGSHWLSDDMREFFSSKLCESNREYSSWRKAQVEITYRSRRFARTCLNLLKK